MHHAGNMGRAGNRATPSTQAQRASASTATGLHSALAGSEVSARLKQRRAMTPAASGSTHSRNSAQKMRKGGGMEAPPLGSSRPSSGPAISGSVTSATRLAPIAVSSANAVLPPARYKERCENKGSATGC